MCLKLGKYHGNIWLVILRPPYEGAKDYYYISDVDDRDYLTALIKATIPALPKPKVKKNPMK